MTRIILWRHGQTTYNAQKRVQGQVDVPLNETGITQAQNAAQLIVKYNPTHIITSDLSRAKETGRTLAKLTDLEIITDERLRERNFGLWEGLTREEITAKWPGEYEKWSTGQQPENVEVEPIDKVGQRFGTCVNEHVDNYHPDSVIVFASHGGAIAKGLVSLLGLNSEFRGIKLLDNCAWAVLDKAPSGDWILSAYNVTYNESISEHLLTYHPK